MSTARTSLFLFLVTVAAPVEAKPKEIVPVAATGISVVATPKGPVARARLANADLEIRLSTHSGFVYLDLSVKNQAAEPLKIGPESLRLEAAGEPVYPLDPDQYVTQRFTKKRYPVDQDGKIDDSEATKGNRVYQSMAGRGLPAPAAIASARPKAKDDEVPRKTLFGGGTARTIHAERMLASTTWIARCKDICTSGGNVATGESASGQHIYQRNGLELPLVATFQPEGSEESISVRFIRE
jgi:hypothetical protein